MTNVAIPTDRLRVPPRLTDDQVMPWGTEGKRPEVMRKQPAYLAWLFVVAMRRMNPIILEIELISVFLGKLARESGVLTQRERILS